MPAARYHTNDPFPNSRILRGAKDADGLADRGLAWPETLCNEVAHDSIVAGVIHVFLIEPSSPQQSNPHGLKIARAHVIDLRSHLGALRGSVRVFANQPACVLSAEGESIIGSCALDARKRANRI